MSLSERIQEINREISATVESAWAELRRDVADRVRAGSEEIARQVAELTPTLPASFLAHEDLSPFAESMAREAAERAAREAGDKAAHESAQQIALASRGAVVDLRDALAAVDRARSQAEILSALLSEATRRFAGRAAVLLVRGGEMRGWAGEGFGEADAGLRDLAFTPSPAGGWSRLAQGLSAVHLSAADCGELCSRIEASLPHEGVVIPLVLRDRVAAGLYADRADGLPAVEALQILCAAAAQSIELLPFRERAFTATLAAETTLAFTPPPPPPPAPPAPAAAETAPTADTVPPAATPEAPAATEPVPAPAGHETAASQAVEIEPEVEAEPEAPQPPGEDTLSEAASPWAAAEPAAELEHDIEALPELPELEAAVAEPAPEEPAPSADTAAAPFAETSPAATVYQPIAREALLGATAEAPPPATAATRLTAPIPILPLEQPARPEETVLLQRPSLREAPAETPVPAPTPLRPVPPPPAVSEPTVEAPSPSLSGIPEVKPPSGVEGPGWAFATSRMAVSPNEEAQHEEARRLARLLVSEIKLYNEEQVEEGRRKKDIYERLKEDIDRSRQMYEERVEPRILKSTDYFYQELVRILAAGDAKALGI